MLLQLGLTISNKTKFNFDYSNMCFQLQHTPQHLVRLLQIAVDGNCDMAVRQIASIQFKNFIAKNWSPEGSSAGEQQRILQSDKQLVRDNILVYVTQVPTLLRYIC